MMKNRVVGAISAGVVGLFSILLMHVDKFMEVKENFVFAFFVLLFYLVVGNFIGEATEEKVFSKKKTTKSLIDSEMDNRK